MRLLPVLLFAAIGIAGQDVRVAGDPFPTDRLTLPDDTQKTGRRVNLPLPDCEGRASDCAELAMINQFDGFNVQARASVRFTAAIDPNTLRDGVFYVWLDPAWPRENLVRPAGTLTRVNRVVWNPATFTMTAKPDDVLEQGRRYALIVTDAVKDQSGAPLTAEPGFLACARRETEGDYCGALASAIELAAPLRPDRQIISASVFTTMTGTATLEAMRDVAGDLPTNVQIGPTIKTGKLDSLDTRAHVRTEGERFDTVPFPAPVIFLSVFGIDSITLGTLESPRFLNAEMMIPNGPPMVERMEKLAFHVLLPNTPMPAGGYPVLLAGHGLGDNRFAGPSVLAYPFMPKGYAIVAINAVGHGYGSDTYLQIRTSAGVQEYPAPGRAVDLNGDGVIENPEGCILLNPAAPVSIRDCLRQTAIDWMSVVRAIQAGIDLDGDGQRDLSPGGMAYWGQSLGAFYGTLFLATEPAVTTGVLNVGGGSATETARLSVGLRPALIQMLDRRQPSLLNAPPDFDEEYTPRDEPVKTLSVAGAAELQEEFERLEWIESSGAPSTFAPHLTVAPRDGMPRKNVLFQFALGDQTVPNPSNSLLSRAAGAQDRTVLYRHDLARQVLYWLPANPHTYFAYLFESGAFNIADAVLQQAAFFTVGGGVKIPEVSSWVRQYFEIPATLPESANFLKP
ncbi:MAG TPA: Ig-like domain-containing protein [Paludibaculum sp.]|jgi:pimeloyl-ACP methyl ester carboxylesterase